jgi:hypothetical protein
MTEKSLEEMNFEEYVDAAEAHLEAIYGLNIFDPRIEFADLADAQDAAMTPIEWVDWFAEEYALLQIAHWD